jgi:hypothetical protein
MLNDKNSFNNIYFLSPQQRKSKIQHISAAFFENAEMFYPWQWIDVPDNRKYILIEKLQISEIKITVSFSKKQSIQEQENKSFFFFKSFAKALGTTVTSLEDVPIIL